MQNWVKALEQIRRIDLRTERDVNGPFAGGYRAMTLGRGMDFEEVREYTPGDEVRFMDWNVTARSGRPHIKRFREEREQTILLLVDMSASGNFGSTSASKRETAALLASTIAFSALKNGDRVGLMLFTDQVELAIPARKGKGSMLRLIKEILTFSPAGQKTRIAPALTHMLALQKRRATIFLISDFAVEGTENTDFIEALAPASMKHEVIALEVRDRTEEFLPDVGKVVFEDAESGETVVVDTGSARTRERYAAAAQKSHRRIQDAFAKAKVAHGVIRTHEDGVLELERFFDRRRRRKKR